MSEINEELKPKTDDWIDFAGNFLKASLIKQFPVDLVVISIETEFDKDEKARLFINTEYLDKKWKLEINKTNQNVLKLNKIESPSQIVGKVLTFDKTMVRNPSLNIQVPSFLLVKVE